VSPAVRPWLAALRRLREVRVAGRQLALLLVLSLGSTAAVLAGALAGGPSDSVLAALARPGVEVRGHPSVASAPAAAPLDVSSTEAAEAPARAAAPRKASKDAGGSSTSASGEGTGEGESTSGEPTTTAPSGTGGGGEGSTPSTPASAPAAPPPAGTKIKHVFVIALASRGYDATFGTAAASSYLTRALVPQGVLLSGYRLLDAPDLPNALALVSGQLPNPSTRQECPTFADFPPSATPGADGSLTDAGCVYPVRTLTLADQLTSAGRRWRAYVEGMGAGRTCRRPGFGAPDPTLAAGASDPYATRRNPFAYFHSLLDLGDCASNDVGLDTLEHDLRTTPATPNLAWIVPNLCHDGTLDACAPGQPGGTAAADAFLAQWIPKILASPAYKADGLLVITFDARPRPPSASGASANEDASDTRRVGTLLLSRWAKPGTTDTTDADPYALLRTIEDVFGVSHLAGASAKDVPSLLHAVLETSAAP
jgi:phosphatidylinositol-3-phosphatase